jgi:hypothetical protein
MTNDLVTPDHLSYLPGAPFSDEEVDAAAAMVRAAAQWHIAPVRNETIILDVIRYDRWLRLPTRQLISVSEIRNADTGEVLDPASYRISREKAQIKRRTWWPTGYEAVEVDIQHGYANCPPDLYAVIAQACTMARRDPTVTSVSIDDYSTSYAAAAAPGVAALTAILGDYALTNTVAYGFGIA